MMGVGNGGTPIVLVGEDSEKTELRTKYCIRNKGILIGTGVDKLKTFSYTNEDFFIMFSLSIGTILCLTPARYINPSYLYALKDVSDIHAKDWASWSFNFL